MPYRGIHLRELRDLGKRQVGWNEGKKAIPLYFLLLCSCGVKLDFLIALQGESSRKFLLFRYLPIAVLSFSAEIV
ncbi:hypothetical protein KL86DPRO_10436 [uncultured delta proteobacterium]|uniref:Uncharacterized protein n=1 Tax=uncultured delta proteobacterium TaxID=34034 RepID=A0A212J0C2_9DELT|nr:hypothetical protein KL86DPRO_10436 [uncultured delta proteobacterium]